MQNIQWVSAHVPFNYIYLYMFLEATYVRSRRRAFGSDNVSWMTSGIEYGEQK